MWSDPRRQPPVVALDVQLANQVPDFALVVSVHDHEAVIARNLGSVLDNAAGIWELVVVFDGCSDGSLPAVLDLLRARTPTLLRDSCVGANGSLPQVATRIRLVDQPTSVWETSSDNIGAPLGPRTLAALALPPTHGRALR